MQAVDETLIPIIPLNTAQSTVAEAEFVMTRPEASTTPETPRAPVSSTSPHHSRSNSGVVEAPVVDAQLPVVTESERQEVLLRQGTLGEQFNLLFVRPDYLGILKNEALVGKLTHIKLRSLCWRLFLNVLPEDKGQWKAVLAESRRLYDREVQEVGGVMCWLRWSH